MKFDLTPRAGRQAGLKYEDYVDAAAVLRCEVSAIRAVDAVESAGSGFLKSGRPKILFEGHIFYKNLKKYGKALAGAQLDATVCYPKWTKKFYFGGEKEYVRLERAIAVCEKLGVPLSAALSAASWQRYQIVAENYKAAGFNSVEEFVEAMFQSEYAALLAFVAYVKSNSLADEIRRKDWAGFARAYNGPAYKRNAYDVKMANADKKFAALNNTTRGKVSKILEKPIDQVLPCTAVASASVSCPGTSLDDRYVSESKPTASATISQSEVEPATNNTPSVLTSQQQSVHANSDTGNTSGQSLPVKPANTNSTEDSISKLDETEVSQTLSVSSALDKATEYKQKIDGLGVNSTEVATGFLPSVFRYMRVVGRFVWKYLVYALSFLLTYAAENPLEASIFVVLALLAWHFRRSIKKYVKQFYSYLRTRRAEPAV